MFNYLLLLILLFFNYAFTAEKDNLENLYIKALALTFQGFEKGENELIWPHFRLTDKPIICHFRNGHVYAFGLVRYSSLWEKRLVQHYPILVCPHYPISLMPFNPDFSLEQQQVFIFGLNDDPSFFPLLTLIHEYFHLYQFQFFYPEKVKEAVAEDYQNVDLLTWMELEHRLLVLFLQTQNSNGKLQYLKNYLAVSQTRRQHLHFNSIHWEDHQQKMEGLADYVSIKTFQIFSGIPFFNPEEFLLKMRHKKNKNPISSAQDRLKGRHYFVGAVLGWALDFCEVKDWKLKIEAGASLQAILEEALYLPEREKQECLAEVQKTLNWKEIRKQVNQQLEKERKEKEEILKTFNSQDGIVLHIGIPSGHMSAGGRHQKSYQWGQKKVLLKDNSIAISQDQSWMLRFRNIPLVFEEEPSGMRIFKLQSDDIILCLDNKELQIEEILKGDRQQIPFFSLSLKSQYCELDSKRSGILCIEKDNLLLKFN